MHLFLRKFVYAGRWPCFTK